MDDSNIKVARHIITTNTYMVLASCSQNIPWVAPLFFATDEDYNFYFVSGLETFHAKQILENHSVAVAIFDSRATPELADGVYIEGMAMIVEENDLQKVIDLVYKKRFPDEAELAQHPHSASDFLGDKPRRFFRIEPRRIYKLDKNNPTEVDRRVEINLNDLRRES